jgi:hypothetical protein
MSLFPDRHPQKDFFILDIADVVPKDDTASMEHPLFSLATKPDMRHLLYESGDSRLEITPSYNGLPTIFDKDILIFCISQLMHAKNRGSRSESASASRAESCLWRRTGQQITSAITTPGASIQAPARDHLQDRHPHGQQDGNPHLRH